MSYSDDVLREHSRSKSLESMSEYEIEEYERLGADSKIIPLYFSNSNEANKTYSKAYDCF